MVKLNREKLDQQHPLMIM